ncbi:tyrosine kinase catalytic domain protein [Rhizoctonia solani 123E]|uniref:Tyrosine kinase catalytic domain protein n=1 Tax=Rhizoctonia solani 123E TaxID=1423351 RepID=A0A074RG56_9AGAM|nr:tyrosine kinase catalytic domain protein [Rhizoctonia solani 123E]
MIVHKGHTNGVTSVAYSPDGKSVVSGSWDKTIRIWDAQSPSPTGEPLTGHSRLIYSVSYSPFGNIIASGSSDKTICLWDVNTRRRLGEPIKGDHTFYSVAFSPNTKLIASGCGGSLSSSPSGNSVQLWDVQNMTAATNPFKGHAYVVGSVQFSPDGTRVVSGSNDNTIRVWDIEHGTTVVGPLEGHTDLVFSVTVSPGGSQIVSCSQDKTIRLWDTRSGGTIGNPYEGHTYGVQSVVFSPRGTYVASGSTDKTVRVWDIRTGRQVQLYEGHSSIIYSVVFSPCGQYIASGSNDKKVIIRNILGEDSGLVHPSGPHIITSQMSTQQMFECLTSTGCIDLSAQMDTQQNTAMIVSGGGFGDIRMGRLHGGGKVAIKTWRTNTLEGCDYKTLKRAGRELFLWSKMEHPNVHRLQGVIMFRDQYLGMVSEWMDNGNLHEYLRKQPSADRFELCVQVASGLEYMHSCNTVHGDLKALNVLVSSDGVAKLSDFDFSIMSEASTLVFSESSNSRLGSLRWTAPEMLLEEAPKRTKQSDVYALGMARNIHRGSALSTMSTGLSCTPSSTKGYTSNSPLGATKG